MPRLRLAKQGVAEASHPGESEGMDRLGTEKALSGFDMQRLRSARNRSGKAMTIFAMALFSKARAARSKGLRGQ